MAAQFIGSMVSIDCGDVLGIYQGLLDGIDPSQQMLTIVNAFHNGIRCSVPRITINATDILNLKIVKDVTEAKGLCSAAGQHLRNYSDAQLSTNIQKNGRHVSPQAQDDSIVSFQQSSPAAVPSSNASVTDSTSCGQNKSTALKPSVTASPRGLTARTSEKPSCNLNGKKSQKNSSDFKSSPYKKTGQSNRQPNGSRTKVYDATKVSRCSPNDLRHSVRALTMADDYMPNYNCSLETNHHDMARKRTNSASDLSSTARNGWKGPGGRHAGYGPGSVKEEDDCFAVPVDSIVDDEFDFEKNLALFDKRAVFDKIERDREQTSATPVFTSGPGTSSPRPNDAKYRCDENVLPSRKAVYRQILVSDKNDAIRTCEYVTDSGLIVPSVRPALRDRLLDLAKRNGFDVSRLVEMVGRSAAEMVLQLLGGGNRFDPKNSHQSPRLVVLCGTGLSAAYAINCARLLASRRVHVTVFVPDSRRLPDTVTTELKLLALSGSQLRISNAAGLPTTPVDVIMSTLDSSESNVTLEPWYQPVIDWANANKAPVLSLDPSSDNVSLVAKWSLAVTLPLAYGSHCGQIYLCDVGLPTRLYNDAGLKSYESPFAHKFVIPLHPS